MVQDNHKEEKHHTQHVVSVPTYLLVFAGLIVLLALTVWVAFLDLGIFDRMITLLIAAAKAALIMAYFMHLRYSQPLARAFAGVGLVWLLILLLITIGDYLARGGIVPAN